MQRRKNRAEHSRRGFSKRHLHVKCIRLEFLTVNLLWLHLNHVYYYSFAAAKSGSAVKVEGNEVIKLKWLCALAGPVVLCKRATTQQH